MNDIANKIKEVRKRKCLSQEQLAEAAKVNLRTIQRIENNQNEPRGNTLNLICKVLDINVEDLLDYGKQIDRSYLIYFHLSVLFGIVIPLGNIIIPFILWMNKKDKIIDLKSMGANLLNFQIIWSFLTFIIVIFGAFLKVIRFEIGPFNGTTTFLLLYPFYIINLILPLIFAFRVKKGKSGNFYPRIIKFIK